MVSGISSMSTSTAVTREVDQLFKKVDANQDSKITKSELSQAMQTDNTQANPADQAKKVNAIFDMLDAGGKGYITRQDAAAGLEKAAQAAAGGAQGADRARGGGGGGDGATAAAAATVVNMDPADTNQDGTVSLQEQLAYALAQYQKAEAARQQSSQTVAYA